MNISKPVIIVVATLCSMFSSVLAAADNTPEEWSRHHKATLNPHLAGWWRARKAASFPDGVFNRDAYLEFMKNNPRTPPVQHEATEEDFQEEW